MIEITIKELAVRKGIRNAYNLGLELGLSPAISARLWSGDFQRLDMDTLNAVCRYFGLQPCKFLRYREDDGARPAGKKAK